MGDVSYSHGSGYGSQQFVLTHMKAFVRVTDPHMWCLSGPEGCPSWCLD